VISFVQCCQHSEKVGEFSVDDDVAENVGFCFPVGQGLFRLPFGGKQNRSNIVQGYGYGYGYGYQGFIHWVVSTLPNNE
jgi:hypothetical protein